MNQYKIWPEDKANQLRILWPDNTAAVIGVILGYPRNAIIGKALRMKLTRKKANNSEWRKTKEIEIKKHKEMKPKSIVEKIKKIELVEETPTIPPVKMMNLNDNHCRELMGLDDDYLPTYCGQQVLYRKSYCSTHNLKYHKAPSKISYKVKTKISKYYY